MTPEQRQQARELIRVERAMWSEADPHDERTNADVQAAVDLLEAALDASNETSGDVQKSRHEQLESEIGKLRDQVKRCRDIIVDVGQWWEWTNYGSNTNYPKDGDLPKLSERCHAFAMKEWGTFT